MMDLNPYSQFHENERVIAWWRRWLALPLREFTPFRRRVILALGALWVGIREPLNDLAGARGMPVPEDLAGKGLVIASIFLLLWLCFRAALALPRWPMPIRKHPQYALHGLYWSMLGVLWLTSPESGLWRAVLLGVALSWPYLLWRCGYMLLAGQHGRVAGTRFWEHVITFWPIYGGSNTPYGKGLAYLSRSEAKNEEELAKSQLAGLRLLLLSGVLALIMKLMQGLAYGSGNGLTVAVHGFTLGIPELGDLVRQGSKAPLAASWASIYFELFYQVLHHAIRGHQIIAILRIFGFNVFRNTYKPLLAESVIEFWNRYYYYFKELLSTFFFLPTFTQLGSRLRNWPQLRLLLSVFAAAFVGNMYYHLLQRNEMLAQGDVFEALYNLRSRFFYCALLATGIFLSMVREQRRAGQAIDTGRLARMRRMLGVWTFFGLIFIWNVRCGADFLVRVDFFLGLFGLRLTG